MLIDRNELEASICEDSLYDFVKQFWHEIIPEEPVWNWHIEVLCHYLQEAAERVFLGLPKEHDLVINVPPGTTKSTVASVMFPAWCWIRMPTCRIIGTSWAHHLATDMSRKSRDVIRSDRWTSLFGESALTHLATPGSKALIVNINFRSSPALRKDLPDTPCFQSVFPRTP